MKTSFEQQDYESMAKAMLDILKPYLTQRNNDADERLWTLKETAEFLGVKDSWLYNNDLPGKLKIKGQVRYRKSKLLKFIKEQEIQITEKRYG